MSFTYAQKKIRESDHNDAVLFGSSVKKQYPSDSARLEALESGQTTPAAADLGHRVDLPAVMR